jgi:DNA-binding CsgD family transcriptional regulator
VTVALALQNQAALYRHYRQLGPREGGFPLGAALTSTGLSLLGDMPWSTHFCLFYEAKRDFLDTIAAYFRAGLQGNEFCLLVLPEHGVPSEEAEFALRQASLDAEQHAATGMLEIVSHRDWFFGGGAFEIPKITARLQEKYQKALANGFSGMRFNGSSEWLFHNRSARDFEEFERTLDGVIAGKSMIVLCNFQLDTSRAGEMLTAAHTHHFTLAIRNGVGEIVEATDAPGREHSLTVRELEVLTWVARGKSAWEIGEILGIAKRTVDEHARTAAQKLGAVNRTQAVALALLRRIIEV